MEDPEMQEIVEGEEKFEPWAPANVDVPDIEQQLRDFTLLDFLSDIPEGHGGAICMTVVNIRLFTIAEIIYEDVTIAGNSALVGGTPSALHHRLPRWGASL